jgi:hypothetical protein
MFGLSTGTGWRVPPFVIGILRHGRIDLAGDPIELAHKPHQDYQLHQVYYTALTQQVPTPLLPCLVAQGKVLALLQLLLLVNPQSIECSSDENGINQHQTVRNRLLRLSDTCAA